MSLHPISTFVCAAAIATCMLWVYSEFKGWKLKSRLMLGAFCLTSVGFVAHVFTLAQESTVEHYYRTALFDLASEAARGNSQLVIESLTSYADCTGTSPTRSVIELVDKLKRNKLSLPPP